MEYRAPSSFAVADGVLRRRSGAQPYQRAEEDDIFETAVDGLHRKPTVLLVRRASSSPLLPAFPRSSSRSASLLSVQPSSFVDASAAERHFSPVPLTPCPDGPQRPGSAASAHSTCPPLPTPDFSRPPRFLALFPRGLSLLSQAPRPSFFSRASSLAPDSSVDEARQNRPQSVRSDSQESSGSCSTDSSCDSVDSGRRALIKSIGTTDRFTHKWPRPQSLRNREPHGGDDAASLALLEDGRGVGTDEAEAWTGFKWCLLFSVCTVVAYGTAGLVCALMTWFRTWDQADVMYVADNDILILVTLAGSLLVFTALVGLSGVFLNSRPILAVYTLLLWPAFLALVAIGYVAYKRATFALDHKLNLSWSQYYTPLGRLVVQDALRCCGFYSALHEATPSKRCYPRTSLPGCKGKLYRFERANLALIWSTVFSLVPLHLLNVLVALLCANHVTETFGKGITPKRYRLTKVDVQADAVKIMRGVKGLGILSSGLPLLPHAPSCVSEGGVSEDRVPFLSYEDQQH
ncbi:tetraspanin Tsp2 family [Mycena belliarum]|uniref:Tetraspanin Tsp2 family n=1 Tax=Mycena belliarum TaxID=1033014 RepID=A0AAD6TR11_9AGAR|nr:tetraspanin Tsp2 family [Mycena belliae]